MLKICCKEVMMTLHCIQLVCICMILSSTIMRMIVVFDRLLAKVLSICNHLKFIIRRTFKFATVPSFVPRGYMTCGWTWVCPLAFKKVPSANFQNLPSYPLF